jgi:hypothetical protein
MWGRNPRMETQSAPFVPKTWALPEAIRRRLGNESGRQRLMVEEGHLLAILHTPPKADHDEVRHPAVFWRNPEGEWKSYPVSGGLAALHALMADYKKAANQLDERTEAAVAPREYYEVLRELNPLHRASRNMLSVMEDLRKARPDERELIVLRDHAISSERAVEMAINDAKNGLDFTVAETGERNAREASQATVEAKRLNRLAAFFFPIATLAAVFGMNEPQELIRKEGFLAVLGAGLVLGWFMRAFVGVKSREK